MNDDLLLTFYGDDFTGSTDVMEQLEMGGVPTVLFLDVPTPEQFALFPRVKAVGIAGISRSMTPAQMDAELPDKFKALAQLGAPFFHYKVCSTFDSSPTVGSIGHAIEIGWQHFQPRIVPLIIGAPFLRRYVIFGNLFARVGEVTYRLDRHPTMSQHPITPMHEADLRVHLAKQTDRQIGLIDYWHMLSKSPHELDAFVDARVADGDQILVFDTMDDDHLTTIGRILWERRQETPIFLVGSSGVERALTLYLQQSREEVQPSSMKSPGAASQMIVMSGSAAPGTRDQIQFALDRGFVGIRLDVPALIDPATEENTRMRTISEAMAVLDQGNSVLLYSALGPDDPIIAQTRQHAERIHLSPPETAQKLGLQQGRITKALIEQSGIRRVCIAGGDTSGHTARQLGIFALQAIQTIAPGAPLCHARSSDPQFDKIEIALKGGQNGFEDYFWAILQGKAHQQEVN
ncbi:MAG: four-carbon acid sugar kinase family protein [Anaerolineae bacterium]|nr:four-carbon acid sugar kinase family protein [Anaerolineae bacterium]MCA9895199.1 four-carbon acid sugar kinase family protein [Anaerolineae bacterium]